MAAESCLVPQRRDQGNVTFSSHFVTTWAPGDRKTYRPCFLFKRKTKQDTHTHREESVVLPIFLMRRITEESSRARPPGCRSSEFRGRSKELACASFHRGCFVFTERPGDYKETEKLSLTWTWLPSPEQVGSEQVGVARRLVNTCRTGAHL